MHQNNLIGNEFKKEQNDKMIKEKQAKYDEFKKRNDIEKRLLQEESQKMQRIREERIREQRAYLQNMKLNDYLNIINEKNEEYEKFIENKKINNEKERRRR